MNEEDFTQLDLLSFLNKINNDEEAMTCSVVKLLYKNEIQQWFSSGSEFTCHYIFERGYLDYEDYYTTATDNIFILKKIKIRIIFYSLDVSSFRLLSLELSGASNIIL